MAPHKENLSLMVGLYPCFLYPPCFITRSSWISIPNLDGLLSSFSPLHPLSLKDLGFFSYLDSIESSTMEMIWARSWASCCWTFSHAHSFRLSIKAKKKSLLIRVVGDLQKNFGKFSHSREHFLYVLVVEASLLPYSQRYRN